MFAILLQHCPKDLMQRLKSNDKYWEVNDKKDVITLVMLICGVAHVHDDTTQGTMDIVSSDVALYITFTSSTDTTDYFYQTFLTMVETINDNSGSDGYHPRLFADHYAVLYRYKEARSRRGDEERSQKGT